jgi:hypothetical protein
MNRTDWLSSNDPMPMLHWLRERGGERKLRLFACACCRRLESLRWDHDAPLLWAIERAELHADRPLPPLGDGGELPAIGAMADDLAWRLVHALVDESAWYAASGVMTVVRSILFLRGLKSGNASSESSTQVLQELKAQAALLRDLFGDPFRERPLYLADVVAHEPVLPIAHMIYIERSFHELPVLADALEDAGCIDEEMLEHCREPGEHARGCWVVDAILGKS